MICYNSKRQMREGPGVLGLSGIAAGRDADKGRTSGLGGSIPGKAQKQRAGSLLDGKSSLSDQHVGCREGLHGEAGQEGGGHVGGALNHPTEGLILNLEEERPTGMVFKPVEMPLVQETTGVSEGNWERRPHISRVLVVAVLCKVLEAGACQDVPGCARPRNRSWVCKPRAPTAKGNQRQRHGAFY